MMQRETQLPTANRETIHRRVRKRQPGCVITTAARGVLPVSLGAGWRFMPTLVAAAVCLCSDSTPAVLGHLCRPSHSGGSQPSWLTTPLIGSRSFSDGFFLPSLLSCPFHTIQYFTLNMSAGVLSFLGSWFILEALRQILCPLHVVQTSSLESTGLCICLVMNFHDYRRNHQLNISFVFK